MNSLIRGLSAVLLLCLMAEPAAARGIPLRLLAEASGVSAAQVIPDQLVGDYTDLATLREVTAGCEVLEHVPCRHHPDRRAALDDGDVAEPADGHLVDGDRDRARLPRRRLR